MKDIGYSRDDDELMAEIDRDGFGTLAGPQGRTPVLYLGDAVTVEAPPHPSAHPATYSGEITRLNADSVTVWIEELNLHNDYPYSEVRRG